MPSVAVKQDEQAPVATEILAQAIIEVSRAMKALRESRLTDRALILLIHDACKGKVNKRDIETILDSMGELEEAFVKKEKKVAGKG